MFLCCSTLGANQGLSDLVTEFGIFSSSDVTLTTYSVNRGNVYAGGNLQVDFGYGIQRPTANLGSMYTRGNYSQGSLSEVRGNVFANGSATLTGSAKVIGNVVRGGAMTLDPSASVSGTTTQQSNSVGLISLPAATTFVPGLNNVVATDNLALNPGSYRDVSVTQSSRILTLTSGDYFLKSLTLATSTTLNLQLTGTPLRVFIQQDANFGTGLQFTVNGIGVGTNNANLPVSLAQNVLFESHSDVSIPAGFLSEFFGTIFTPFGGVDMSLQDMHGSIISAGPIVGNVYLDSRPSALVQPVPEPSSILLALLSMVIVVSKRKRYSAMVPVTV